MSLLRFVATWWPVLALLHIPGLAGALVQVLALRTRSELDHQIPDELPMTAGEWLRARLTAFADRGHRLSAIVTDRDCDAYRSDHQLIQLHADTHFKADPVFWATAAHELGHARLRIELPIIGYLRKAATWAIAALVPAGIGLAFGRVLYALPGAGSLAFGCFAVAAGLQLFVLLDEALASVIAYRELHADDAIDFVHLRAIRRDLATAFATYAVPYTAYALLLRFWPLIDALASDVAPVSVELTSVGLVVAVVASIACVITILLRLAHMIAPRELVQVLRSQPLLFSILWLALIGALLWLAWDHRVDATYAWCTTIAFAASSRLLLLVLHTPFGLVRTILVRGIRKLEGRGLDQTPRYLRARLGGAALVRAGNEWLATMVAHNEDHPRWPYRLVALAKLGYVPLLVAFWLT